MGDEYFNFACQHCHADEKSKEIYQKAEEKSNFSYVVKCKFEIKNSIAFLYISKKLQDIKVKYNSVYQTTLFTKRQIKFL